MTDHEKRILRDRVVDRLEPIERLFAKGYKLTLFARAPHLDDGDVLITAEADTDLRALVDAVRRMTTRDPVAESGQYKKGPHTKMAKLIVPGVQRTGKDDVVTAHLTHVATVWGPAPVFSRLFLDGLGDETTSAVALTCPCGRRATLAVYDRAQGVVVLLCGQEACDPLGAIRVAGDA